METKIQTFETGIIHRRSRHRCHELFLDDGAPLTHRFSQHFGDRFGLDHEPSQESFIKGEAGIGLGL